MVEDLMLFRIVHTILIATRIGTPTLPQTAMPTPCLALRAYERKGML
jgi:hypothetical protein